jgi:hypothetical protein
MPSSIQTADAVAKLEQYRRMITLDEAVEILTGRKPPLGRRILRPLEISGWTSAMQPLPPSES